MTDNPTWAIVLWGLYTAFSLHTIKDQLSMILRAVRNMDK